MLLKDGTFNSEGSALLHLVSGMRQLGIEVPKSVDAEIQIYHDLRKARENAQRDYDAAVNNLRVVDADAFDTAKAGVVNASLEMFAVSQGVDKVLIDAVSGRLGNQVFDATNGWEAEVVERFNDVVAEYKLNDVAQDLPNFADRGSFNILTLSRQQGHAVELWRTAADHLHPLWDAYRRLGSYHGHLLGPVESSDRSTNLFTACVLGEPDSFGAADAAATRFAELAFGADSVRPYAPIAPFVVPAMVGYRLQLSSLRDAAEIRRRVQGL